MQPTKEQCRMLNERGVKMMQWEPDYNRTFSPAVHYTISTIIDAIEHKAGEVFHEWRFIKRGDWFSYQWTEICYGDPRDTSDFRDRLRAALAFAEYFPTIEKDDELTVGDLETRVKDLIAEREARLKICEERIARMEQAIECLHLGEIRK